MLLQTFTLLLLLSTSALASQSDTTTEALPPTSSQPTMPIKEEHFPAMAPAQAAESALIEAQPGSLQPPLSVVPSLEAEDGLRRRLITYDQRQEGQYNIRADLENFMIVLIPPGPQEGLSLLDLLTKSSLRGATKGSNNKRKHAHAAALKSFYQRQQLQPQLHQQQQQQQLQLPQGPISDFIEGRTPYHVDISAVSEEQQPRLHRQQVDVLPPQLLPMPQLIKPYHLEAEPELIQALPPVATASSSSTGGNNLLEGYNQMGSHYYRNSRSLGGDSFLDTNRLSSTDTGSSSNGRAISVPLYRSDIAQSQASQQGKSGNGNALYPPIDVPAYIINEAQPRLWQLDDEPTPIQPKHLVDADVLSFELLGADALADSKTLLRDGLARCAPGQRRDSYGACRQVEGY
ncbi:hypothetical protein KR093_008999 [Drosophila rubida]|uniref:Uncharacterized protein n=1 Tax=Drosophila rubida TaxID=30044 RepID=A0AAD4PNH9_9MUSC|nr:hypothetical protein KR093_008999 [Drosophila rubida]